MNKTGRPYSGQPDRDPDEPLIFALRNTIGAAGHIPQLRPVQDPDIAPRPSGITVGVDGLGRARGIGSMTGGDEEKEQTLNQLPVELDGFDPSAGLVLLAAINRPEILDPALLR